MGIGSSRATRDLCIGVVNINDAWIRTRSPSIVCSVTVSSTGEFI